jgi:putative addiction module CopG family antidote
LVYNAGMSITLSPELEKRVQIHVESGAFASPQEVLKEAFRLLLQREKKEKSCEPRMPKRLNNEVL